MSPILDSIGSVKAYGWGSFVQIANSFESIATATGTGSSPTLTFSSIPNTYSHLQIRLFARGTNANNNCTVYMRFNSDSTSGNYRNHYLVGDGSTAASGTNATGNSMITLLDIGSSGSSSYSATIVDILDYKNSNKYKTARILSGYDRNGAGFMDFESGLWLNTSAINTITLTIGDASCNFDTSSVAALYGIKGAQ